MRSTMWSSTSRPSGPAATRTPARSGSVRRCEGREPARRQRVDALHLARRGRGIGGDDGMRDMCGDASRMDRLGRRPSGRVAHEASIRPGLFTPDAAGAGSPRAAPRP